MVGNALGDGKPKEDVNGTKSEENLSFSDKYRKELKKDLSEIDIDEEEDDDTTYESENADEVKATEAEPVDENMEEEVSAQDMFDEM